MTYGMPVDLQTVKKIRDNGLLKNKEIKFFKNSTYVHCKLSQSMKTSVDLETKQRQI